MADAPWVALFRGEFFVGNHRALSAADDPFGHRPQRKQEPPPPCPQDNQARSKLLGLAYDRLVGPAQRHVNGGFGSVGRHRANEFIELSWPSRDPPRLA